MIKLLRALNGMLGIVPALAWLALLVAALLHGCAVGLQRDRARNQLHALEASTAKAEAVRAKVALEANSNFRKFEHQQAASAVELEHANQKRKAAALLADDYARAADERLRRTIAELDAGARARAMPSAAACPAELAASRREAEGARAVLGACTSRYRELGAAAALDGNDLDTALGYIDLVHGH